MSTDPAPAITDTPRSVVFLHGQPGDASEWKAVIAALPSNLKAMTFDRPGYGTNPEGPTDFDGNAAWLLDQLDTAQAQPAIVVGHSFGGGVALAAAATAPEKVAGLVLVSSVGPDCLDGWDLLLASPVAGPICALAAWWLTPWFARWRLARIQRRLGRPLALEEHANWDVWANSRHDHGAMWRTFLIEQRALVAGIDLLRTYALKTRVPTVVMADQSDPLVPLATARKLHEQLRHSRLVLTDGSGHHLPRRNPRLVARQIADLARALPTGAGDIRGPVHTA